MAAPTVDDLNLSTEEVETLKKTFEVFDTSQDGFVDASELETAFENYGTKRRRSSVLRMMQGAGASDNNPGLDFEEFCILVKTNEMDQVVTDLWEKKLDTNAVDLDEEKKKLEASLGRRVSQGEVRASVLGQFSDGTPMGPASDPELMQVAIEDFDAEVESMKEKVKKNLLTAVERVDDEYWQDLKQKFIKCEELRGEKAAMRACKYWDMLVDIFGPEKAFLPLTQAGAFRDDVENLKVPFLHDTGMTDDHGQHVFIYDWEHQNDLDTDAMLRTALYVTNSIHRGPGHPFKAHVAVSRVIKSLGDMNPALYKKLVAWRNVSPSFTAALHYCYPPKSIRIIANVARLIMGQLRSRVKIHDGSEEEVLAELKKYGLGREVLPKDLGGDLELMDKAEWVKKMALQEQQELSG